MTDLFDRLASLALGDAETVTPALVPRFAEGPPVPPELPPAPDEPGGLTETSDRHATDRQRLESSSVDPPAHRARQTADPRGELPVAESSPERQRGAIRQVDRADVHDVPKDTSPGIVAPTDSSPERQRGAVRQEDRVDGYDMPKDTSPGNVAPTDSSPERQREAVQQSDRVNEHDESMDSNPGRRRRAVFPTEHIDSDEMPTDASPEHRQGSVSPIDRVVRHDSLTDSSPGRRQRAVLPGEDVDNRDLPEDLILEHQQRSVQQDRIDEHDASTESNPERRQRAVLPEEPVDNHDLPSGSSHERQRRAVLPEDSVDMHDLPSDSSPERGRGGVPLDVRVERHDAPMDSSSERERDAVLPSDRVDSHDLRTGSTRERRRRSVGPEARVDDHVLPASSNPERHLPSILPTVRADDHVLPSESNSPSQRGTDPRLDRADNHDVPAELSPEPQRDAVLSADGVERHDAPMELTARRQREAIFQKASVDSHDPPTDSSPERHPGTAHPFVRDDDNEASATSYSGRRQSTVDPTARTGNNDRPASSYVASRPSTFDPTDLVRAHHAPSSSYETPRRTTVEPTARVTNDDTHAAPTHESHHDARVTPHAERQRSDSIATAAPEHARAAGHPSRSPNLSSADRSSADVGSDRATQSPNVDHTRDAQVETSPLRPPRLGESSATLREKTSANGIPAKTPTSRRIQSDQPAAEAILELPHSASDEAPSRTRASATGRPDTVPDDALETDARRRERVSHAFDLQPPNAQLQRSATHPRSRTAASARTTAPVAATARTTAPEAATARSNTSSARVYRRDIVPAASIAASHDSPTSRRSTARHESRDRAGHDRIEQRQVLSTSGPTPKPSSHTGKVTVSPDRFSGSRESIHSEALSSGKAANDAPSAPRAHESGPKRDRETIRRDEQPGRDAAESTGASTAESTGSATDSPQRPGGNDRAIAGMRSSVGHTQRELPGSTIPQSIGRPSYASTTRDEDAKDRVARPRAGLSQATTTGASIASPMTHSMKATESSATATTPTRRAEDSQSNSALSARTTADADARSGVTARAASVAATERPSPPSSSPARTSQASDTSAHRTPASSTRRAVASRGPRPAHANRTDATAGLEPSRPDHDRVQIRIGRIRITAEPAAKLAASVASTLPVPSLSLEDYVARRSGESS